MAVRTADSTATEALLDRAVGGGARQTTGLQARPGLRVAIVACMDARLMVEDLLGLQAGEAHVIRNAGGLVTDDVIRSLAISQRRLGTREIVVVRHTNCGMLGFDDAGFLAEVAADGRRPDWEPGRFHDLEQGVRVAVRDLGANPFLAHTDRIRGFVYDVATGALDEVRAGR